MANVFGGIAIVNFTVNQVKTSAGRSKPREPNIGGQNVICVVILQSPGQRNSWRERSTYCKASKGEIKRFFRDSESRLR